MLGRVEQRLAYESVRRNLDLLPEPELARIAIEQDVQAVISHGISEALVAIAVGNPQDPAERDRRLDLLFHLSASRLTRLRPFIQEVVE